MQASFPLPSFQRTATGSAEGFLHQFHSFFDRGERENGGRGLIQFHLQKSVKSVFFLFRALYTEERKLVALIPLFFFSWKRSQVWKLFCCGGGRALSCHPPRNTHKDFPPYFWFRDRIFHFPINIVPYLHGAAFMARLGTAISHRSVAPGNSKLFQFDQLFGALLSRTTLVNRKRRKREGALGKTEEEGCYSRAFPLFTRDFFLVKNGNLFLFLPPPPGTCSLPLSPRRGGGGGGAQQTFKRDDPFSLSLPPLPLFLSQLLAMPEFPKIVRGKNSDPSFQL